MLFVRLVWFEVFEMYYFTTNSNRRKSRLEMNQIHIMLAIINGTLLLLGV